MKTASLALTVAFGVVVSACASTETQYISSKAVLSAQEDINRQVAIYYKRTHPAPQGAAVEHSRKWCGNGSVDFDIISIKLDLLTTSDIKKGFTASGSTPTVVTVKPALGFNRERISSQEVTFMEYLLADRYQPAELATAEQTGRSDIADRLVDLRDGLVGSAAAKPGSPPVPCFTDFDAAKPADAPHQVIIGLKAIDDGNGGVSFGLGPVSFGVTADDKQTRANTLTVAFRQHGLTAKTQTGPCPNAPNTLCSFEPKPTPPMPPGAPAPPAGSAPPVKMCVVTQEQPGVFFNRGGKPAEAPCPVQGA